MIKRFLCVLLSLMLLAGACAALAEEPAAAAEGEVPAEAEVAAEVAAEAEPAAESEESVLLATINGVELSSDSPDVEYWISLYLYQLSSSGYDVSNAEMLQLVNQYALYNAMRAAIIHQKAAELGLDQISDEEKASMESAARASWEEGVSSYTENVTDESTEEEKAAARADAIAALLADGYEEESYIQEYIDNEINNLYVNRLLDHVSAGMEVTDEEIQAHFDALVQEDKNTYEDISTYEFYTQYYQQPSYYTPEGYRGITDILLKPDDTLLNDWKDLTARYEEQMEAGEETEEAAEAEAEPEIEVVAEPEVEVVAEAAPDAETPAADESEAEEPAETPGPTSEPVTAEMVEAAKQAIIASVQSTVDEIMAKFNAGTSFDDLIKEYGTDPGMQDDATRAAGYPVHKDSIIWDPAFTAGAMALEKIGDVSEPIVGQYGVHILYYLRDIPAGAVELTEAMKTEIRDELLEQKQSEALNAALDQWIDESDVVYTEAGEAWKLPEAEPATETEA